MLRISDFTSTAAAKTNLIWRNGRYATPDRPAAAGTIRVPEIASVSSNWLPERTIRVELIPRTVSHKADDLTGAFFSNHLVTRMSLLAITAMDFRCSIANIDTQRHFRRQYSETTGLFAI